jgi:hypothetical protein
MPRFNQNLNEFGVTPSYKHEELPGGWCAAYGSIQILKHKKKHGLMHHFVEGRPTFYTPAPLLQELGLNTLMTAVLRQRQLYYGNDSCITRTTAVLRKRQLYYGNDSCITETTAVLQKAIFSVLEAVTHTHPTMLNKFI